MMSLWNEGSGRDTTKAISRLNSSTKLDEAARQPLLQSELIEVEPASDSPIRNIIGRCFIQTGSSLSKVTRCIAIASNTPLSIFYWFALLRTYDMIAAYAHGDIDTDETGVTPDINYWSGWFIMLSVFNVIRLICSALVDLISPDLINTKLFSAKTANAHWAQILLLRIIQLNFLFTATLYSLSYATGVILLIPNPSLAAQIFITVMFTGLGVCSYFLLTNCDLEDHVLGLPHLVGALRRCFSDGAHAMRMIVCLESALFVMPLFRMITAGNDWLTYVDTLDCMNQVDDNAIKNVYIAGLVSACISTFFSRVKSIYRTTCPRQLTEQERVYKKKLGRISIKDIPDILRCLAQSVGLAYFILSNSIGALVFGLIYAIFQISVTLDINRTYRAITFVTQREMTEPLSVTAQPHENSYDRAIVRLRKQSGGLMILAYMVALLGRSVRLDSNPDFIQTNNQALSDNDIVTLHFSPLDTFALALYIGMVTVFADMGWYAEKLYQRGLDISLRYRIFSQQHNGSPLWTLIGDWTKKEDYDISAIDAAVPTPMASYA
ncbi:MAG: hypothetical protein COB66_08670 [Coxiella sp. (in: Bacteria)]|nr:MAG: hypothetical protein COB66_08670 [Coxiella sp. (in: g-proteobacteria)]